MKQFRVVVNGNEYRVAIEELQKETNAPVLPFKQQTVSSVPQLAKPSLAKAAQLKAEVNRDADRSVSAAMPGTILDIKVAVGDAVKRGQVLMILEAMKMENEIMASCDGIVEKIYVDAGASVNSGDLLIVLT